VEFGGPGGRERRRCPLDASKAIKFQAFVQDSTIECFVNAQYAFTFGAQNASSFSPFMHLFAVSRVMSFFRFICSHTIIKMWLTGNDSIDIVWPL
jgi:hypothetical protein